jgi:hypothetical protein
MTSSFFGADVWALPMDAPVAQSTASSVIANASPALAMPPFTVARAPSF